MKKMFSYGFTATIVALMMGLNLTSCGDDKKDTDPNAGKTDPSTIATANLVAYFPFESDGKDQVGNLTPSKQNGVTYVAGRRGNCYQGAAGVFLGYNLPASSKLKTLKAFTVSFWYNASQLYNKDALETGNPATADPEAAILQIGTDSGDKAWGNLLIGQLRCDAPVDSLKMKTFMYSSIAPDWKGQHVSYSNPAFQKERWVHIIQQYNNVTSELQYFVNGIKLTQPAGVTKRWAGSGETTPYGDLAFVDASQLCIGGWVDLNMNANTANTWMGYVKGKIDEMRIYDRALTDAEAKALYDAEITWLE